MSRVPVVVDAGPLIYLAVLGHYDLLWHFFDPVYIPTAVYGEVVQAGQDMPGARETQKGVDEGKIQVVSVSDRLAVEMLLSELDAGESEVIVLAREQGISRVIIDDKRARLHALRLGLDVTGTIGILLLAQTAGLDVNMKESLDELRQHNFRISDTLYRRLVRRQP